jgi:hypothetical protein
MSVGWVLVGAAAVGIGGGVGVTSEVELAFGGADPPARGPAQADSSEISASRAHVTIVKKILDCELI